MLVLSGTSSKASFMDIAAKSFDSLLFVILVTKSDMILLK